MTTERPSSLTAGTLVLVASPAPVAVAGTGAERAETLPAASTATTVNAYAVSLARPVTVPEVPGAGTVATVLPSAASTRCSTTSAPAASHRSSASRFPGTAATPVGAGGGVRSVGVALAVAASERF